MLVDASRVFHGRGARIRSHRKRSQGAKRIRRKLPCRRGLVLPGRGSVLSPRSGRVTRRWVLLHGRRMGWHGAQTRVMQPVRGVLLRQRPPIEWSRLCDCRKVRNGPCTEPQAHDRIVSTLPRAHRGSASPPSQKQREPTFGAAASASPLRMHATRCDYSLFIVMARQQAPPTTLRGVVGVEGRVHCGPPTHLPPKVRNNVRGARSPFWGLF